MASTDQVTFLLDRFEWTEAGQLRVGGAWSGLGRHDLDEPALIVHSGDGDQRLQAVNGVFTSTRHWTAIFPWEDDPGVIEAATLEVAGSLVVDLPAPQRHSGHRRFGRTRLTVRAVRAEDVRSAETGVGTDAMTAYAAAIAAREEAATAKEELKLARAAVSRAREDAERERARRTSEGARLHEALETLTRMAEESKQQDRAEVQRLADELRSAESALATERASRVELRDALSAAFEARDEATERANAYPGEIERLQGLLGEAEEHARRARERAERLDQTVAAIRAAFADDG